MTSRPISVSPRQGEALVRLLESQGQVSSVQSILNVGPVGISVLGPGDIVPPQVRPGQACPLKACPENEDLVCGAAPGGLAPFRTLCPEVA